MGFNIEPIKLVLGIGKYDLSQCIRIKRGFINSLYVNVSFIGRDGKPFIIPSGSTAKVRMLKPDKNKVLNDTEDNGLVTGNTVTFKITEQMQAYPGDGALEIILFNRDQIVTSSTCGIKILENVHDDSNIESTDEYISVIETLAKVDNAIKDANTAISNANNAATLANQKAELADEKASLADSKATLANNAASVANEKAQLAEEKASLANAAAENANAVTESAIAATNNAITATQNAIEATQDANTATVNANYAANLALSALEDYQAAEFDIDGGGAVDESEYTDINGGGALITM